MSHAKLHGIPAAASNSLLLLALAAISCRSAHLFSRVVPYSQQPSHPRQGAQYESVAVTNTSPSNSDLFTAISTTTLQYTQSSARLNNVKRQCNQDIEDNPTNSKAYLKRSICYMRQHNYEEVLNDAMQSTKLNDASADAWFMLGQAHMGLGHYRAAISAFRRANTLDPANTQIRTAILQAEQVLEEVQQGKYSLPAMSAGAANAGRNTA